MFALRKFWSGLSALFKKKLEDGELDEELRDFLAQRAATKMQTGLNREQALRRARMEMGSMDSVKEKVRAVGWETAFNSFWQDVRYALRQLRRNPGFTAVAVLTLALGIGANTAIFSVVNSVVLQPLPYAHASQLVVISEVFAQTPAGAGLQSSESYMNFLDWQREAKSFSSLAAYQFEQTTLTGHGAPTIVPGAMTSSSLFTTLGIAPLLGRTLEPQDDVKGAARVVVIGEGLWRGQFGADPNIVGKSIQLASQAFTVVGVMPADFRYPDQTPFSEYWIPAMQSASYASFIDQRAPHFLIMIGRLKPGVAYAQAESEINAIHKVLVKQYNTLDPTEVLHVSNLKRLVVGDTCIAPL